MNHNDRALAGLAWLAATLPTLVQQDCIGGDEVTSISADGFGVKLQVDDNEVAERIAARLGVPIWQAFEVRISPDGRQYASECWRGYVNGVEVTIAYCDHIVDPTECMDEVTA